MLDISGRLAICLGLLNFEVRSNTKKFMDEICKFEETGFVVFPLLNSNLWDRCFVYW